MSDILTGAPEEDSKAWRSARAVERCWRTPEPELALTAAAAAAAAAAAMDDRAALTADDDIVGISAKSSVAFAPVGGIEAAAMAAVTQEVMMSLEREPLWVTGWSLGDWGREPKLREAVMESTAAAAAAAAA